MNESGKRLFEVFDVTCVLYSKMKNGDYTDTTSLELYNQMIDKLTELERLANDVLTLKDSELYGLFFDWHRALLYRCGDFKSQVIDKIELLKDFPHNGNSLLDNEQKGA